MSKPGSWKSLGIPGANGAAGAPPLDRDSVIESTV